MLTTVNTFFINKKAPEALAVLKNGTRRLRTISSMVFMIWLRSTTSIILIHSGRWYDVPYPKLWGNERRVKHGKEVHDRFESNDMKHVVRFRKTKIGSRRHRTFFCTGLHFALRHKTVDEKYSEGIYEKDLVLEEKRQSKQKVISFLS